MSIPDSARGIEARQRAGSYGLLAWLFLDNVDEGFLDRLRAENLDSDHAEPPGEQALEGLREMRSALDGYPALSPSALCLELAVQRTRLFRGIAPGYGPRPPYEALYRNSGVGGEAPILAQLQEALAAAGAAIPPGREDRPDYLGLELELMRLWCEEEGGHWEAGDTPSALAARETQSRFLRDHLLSWVPRYCDDLARETYVPFYHGVALLLAGFLDGEARQFDI